MRTTTFVLMIGALALVCANVFAGNETSTSPAGKSLNPGGEVDDAANALLDLITPMANNNTCGTSPSGGLESAQFNDLLQSSVATSQNVTTTQGTVQQTAGAQYGLSTMGTTTSSSDTGMGTETPGSYIPASSTETNPSDGSGGGSAVSPEPSTMLIFGVAVAGLYPFVRRRKV